jgi:hypothetical protein
LSPQIEPWHTVPQGRKPSFGALRVTGPVPLLVKKNFTNQSNIFLALPLISVPYNPSWGFAKGPSRHENLNPRTNFGQKNFTDQSNFFLALPLISVPYNPSWGFAKGPSRHENLNPCAMLSSINHHIAHSSHDEMLTDELFSTL